MGTDKFTRDGDKRFTLRIDQDLFDKIAERAKKNKRSVGKEIEWILEEELNKFVPYEPPYQH